jgi:hypothetical protein
MMFGIQSLIVMTTSQLLTCPLLQMQEIYKLLYYNYVEDARFRFDYSAEFLLWFVLA